MNSCIALGLGFGSLWYWASTILSLITLSILAVWFGLVQLLRCKPQTEPNRAVQCKSHPNSSEPSAVSVWIGLICGFSIGLVRF